MTRRPEPHPCGACHRVVAYRTAVQRMTGGGKHRVRHKCPHGQWCQAGHRFARLGWNWPTCPDCLDARRAEVGLPPQRRRGPAVP